MIASWNKAFKSTEEKIYLKLVNMKIIQGFCAHEKYKL